MAQQTGCAVVDWKVGLTSEAAKEAFDIPEPVAGPLFESFVIDSSLESAVAKFDLHILEPEIGSRLGMNLPKGDRAHTCEEVIGSIDAVMPVIELATTRLPGGIKQWVKWVITDGAYSQTLVIGSSIHFQQRHFSLRGTRAFEDGVEINAGVGPNALSVPLAVMVRPANHLNALGLHLRKGDVLAAGVLTDVIVGTTGKTYRAEYHNPGTVDVTLTAR